MRALSVAGEDYLKTIFHLTHRGEAVTTGAVASALEVASPSATAMLHRLERDALVSRTHGRQVRLTERGERAALRVVRRHRLVETFLAQVVGMSWDEVHVEAELLEHSVSDQLEDRIDALLGYPERDPHGDPIPPREGPHHERWDEPLAAAAPGDRFLVTRVSDRDPEMLRYLATLQVRPGTRLRVDEIAPFGGPVWVRTTSGRRHALGSPLAQAIHGHLEHDSGHDSGHDAGHDAEHDGRDAR